MKKMFRVFLPLALVLALLSSLEARHARAQGTTRVFATCNSAAWNVLDVGRPLQLLPDGTLCVNASVSASVAGFTPNGNFGTLTATAATSASTAMPAGAVVAFQNTSAVDVSCVVAAGVATATTNKIIVRGGSTIFVTVGSNLNAACINQTGTASNLVAMAGGVGLGTGFGGGGGGGGGAVTISDGGSVALGATTDAACATANGTCSLIALTKYSNVTPPVLGTGSAVIGALLANQSVNLAQVAGVATPVGNGVQATAPRFTMATDSPGIITLGPATAANSVPMTVGPALLGSYCMGANSGTMAAGLAAAAPVFSFRYGAANLAIVRKVTAEANDITTAFVAGAAKFDMIVARSFTASDTGGTAATLTGNNGKLRTSFATTGISDFRISSTATLTAGTRTLDAQPLGSVEFAVPTSIDAGLLPSTNIFLAEIGQSPIVLAQNEGFVLQATVPGTGTWVFSVRVCWDEVSAF